MRYPHRQPLQPQENETMTRLLDLFLRVFAPEFDDIDVELAFLHSISLL